MAGVCCRSHVPGTVCSESFSVPPRRYCRGKELCGHAPWHMAHTATDSVAGQFQGGAQCSALLGDTRPRTPAPCMHECKAEPRDAKRMHVHTRRMAAAEMHHNIMWAAAAMMRNTMR
jgi:hypothetical protein